MSHRRQELVRAIEEHLPDVRVANEDITCAICVWDGVQEPWNIMGKSCETGENHGKPSVMGKHEENMNVNG